ncbi:MAG: TfoX/Sxy family protein [Betaproteobacteria bacterium]|nr:TfoX/Sxy family protein [Betaproteobacteria bacterium]
MATDQQFADYVLDQIREAGAISFRRMFGEYAVYCDSKVVALLCDNQFFLKPTVAGREALGQPVEAPPYPGAKLYFLVDEGLEDSEAISRLVRLTADALPMPKPRRPKKSKK